MDDPPENREWKSDEYEYVGQAAAVETFTNLMRDVGIIIAWDGKRFIFTSSRLLNMKRLKASGVISSYTISALNRQREIIEEG